MELRERLILPMQRLVAARDALHDLAAEEPEHASALRAIASNIETQVLDHIAGLAQRLRDRRADD